MCCLGNWLNNIQSREITSLLLVSQCNDYLSLISGLLVWMGCFQQSEGNGKYGYFSEVNSSKVLLSGTVWDVVTNNKQTEFSFRTCSNGELLFQNGTGGDSLRLHLVNSSLEFQWKVGNQSGNVLVAGSFNTNEWFNVNMYRLLGNLYLNVSRAGRVIHHEIISNSTFRMYILTIDLSGSMGLYVGRDFTGCFMEGVNVIFSSNVNIVTQSVIWSNESCTQSDNTCANIGKYILFHLLTVPHCGRARILPQMKLRIKWFPKVKF